MMASREATTRLFRRKVIELIAAPMR